MYIKIFDKNYVYNYTHTETFFILFIEFHVVRMQTKFCPSDPHHITR